MWPFRKKAFKAVVFLFSSVNFCLKLRVFESGEYYVLIGGCPYFVKDGYVDLVTDKRKCTVVRTYKEFK